MKTVLVILGIVVAVVVVYFIYKSAYPSSSSSTPVTTTAISIKNFAFDPNNISVSIGQEVTWTNNDSTTHTIVADDNSFNSGDIKPGQNFKKTFNSAGTVNYHCSIHSSMTGKVEVK